MSNTPISRTETAAWERWLSAFNFLLLIPLQLGGILGLVLFLTMRHRRKYVAHHGLQAAIWFLCYFVIGLGIFFLLPTETRSVINFIAMPQQSQSFQQLWGLTTFAEHVTIVLLSLLVLMNLLVAVWGAITTLLGHVFTIPFIGKYITLFPIHRKSEK